MSEQIELRHVSKRSIETSPLPGPAAVLSIADAQDMRATVADAASVRAYLFLCFCDASVDHGLVRRPRPEDARAILRFYERAVSTPGVKYLVAQCEAGVGRSQAVVAALLRIQGKDNRHILRNGTFNRVLYQHLVEAAGLAIAREPLVSIVVRLKYPSDRLQAFMLCMDRQRYMNWEVVAVTDGAPLFEVPRHPKLRVIRTPEARGRWGHPYRQLGIDAAAGAWIGLSNDDNYYVPGYLEQMVFAGQEQEADLVLCQMLHSHCGWRAVGEGVDLGGFLARREIVRAVQWPGSDFASDRAYVENLRRVAARIAVIDRPLFIHN